MCDAVYALPGDGRLRHLPGGVDDYLATRSTSPSTAAPARKADSRATRKELQRVERALERLARREQELHTALAERASDYEAVLGLDAELREVLAEKARLEDQWLQLAEEAS